VLGAAWRVALALCALLLPACDSAVPTANGPRAASNAGLARPWPKRPNAAEGRQLGPQASLLPFLAALEGIETGLIEAPVSILQIGDSHTAADLLSGRLRELLQQRFGAAGRGMLPPGIPYRYYRPHLVEVAQSDGWQPSSSADRDAVGPFGLAGLVQRTGRAGERMTLGSTEAAGFDRGFVEVARAPGGGNVAVEIDGRPVRQIATAAAQDGVEWVEFDAPAHSHELSLTAAGDGSVTVLSWGVQRRHPGVLYENFGIIGARVGIIGHWDRAVLAEELARRGPALIIVAFGTNESVAREAALDGYGETFAARVSELADAAPQSAILILGPPDVNRRYPAGTSGACGAAAAESATKPRSRTARARAAKPPVWAPPPGLVRVRAAQRQAAERNGWYFWDWSEAMGGPCGMDRWTRADPPLGADDHIHLRAAGYRLTAERLFEALMGEYRRYRARPIG